MWKIITILMVLGVFFISSESRTGENHWVSFSIGGKFRNNIVNRGATYYDSWQLTPVIYVGFWDHRIQFLGNSIEFRETVIPDYLRLRTKLAKVSDEPFYETSGEAKGIRNSRIDSWEWVNTAELFIREYGEFNLVYAKDLRVHNGDYIELTPRLYLPGIELSRLKRVRPEAFTQIGWGSSRHNQFQYGGRSDNGSFSYLAYGLQISLPDLFETIYPVAQLYRYQALGENRNGNRVNDKTEGYQFNFTFGFKIFEI